MEKFLWNLILGIFFFFKYVANLQIWFISDTLHVDFTYVLLLLANKFALKAILCNFQYFYIVGSDMCLKPCVYIVTVVTRTRHNVTLNVHCLSCSHTCVQSGRNFYWSVWGTWIMFPWSVFVANTLLSVWQGAEVYCCCWLRSLQLTLAVACCMESLPSFLCDQ